MKKSLLTILIMCFSFLAAIPVDAREREVKNVNKAEIVSEGLHFRVCDICQLKNTITITVQAKNKSMLSQAVYIELLDETTAYRPLKATTLGLFNPLKFNKPVTEKLSFNIPDTKKNYKIALYSRDIFKKNKKQLITKMSLKEIKTELEKGSARSLF